MELIELMVQQSHNSFQKWKTIIDLGWSRYIWSSRTFFSRVTRVGKVNVLFNYIGFIDIGFPSKYFIDLVHVNKKLNEWLNEASFSLPSTLCWRVKLMKHVCFTMILDAEITPAFLFKLQVHKQYNRQQTIVFRDEIISTVNSFFNIYIYIKKIFC